MAFWAGKQIYSGINAEESNGFKWLYRETYLTYKQTV